MEKSISSSTKNGSYDGIYQEFYGNGKLLETNYTNGLFNGEYKEYCSNGNIKEF